MADPLNWSEHGNYDACVTISALTGLVYGGFTAFPLGIYSIAEGEALEATGVPRVGDYGTLIPAVQARYGKTIRALSTGSIADAVTRPGIGLVLAGFGCIPGTAWQQAGFAQYHSVFVVPKPLGTVLLFDPMTPNQSPGQLIDAAIIVAWAKGAGVNDAREIRESEYAPPSKVDVVTYPSPRTWYTKAGILVGRRLDPPPLTATGTFGAGSPALASAEYTITPTPSGWPAGPYQLVQNGAMAGYLLANSQITLDPVPLPPAPAPAPVPAPEPAPEPAPAPVPVPPAIDIPAALVNLNALTADLNAIYRARAAAVTHKNAAKKALGG